MSSSRSVTAATAGPSVHASTDGAACPFMSLRLSSAMSVRSNPERSDSADSARRYGHSTLIPSSGTLRSQPPKTGIQYPKRMAASVALAGPASAGARVAAAGELPPQRVVHWLGVVGVVDG